MGGCGFTQGADPSAVLNTHSITDHMHFRLWIQWQARGALGFDDTAILFKNSILSRKNLFERKFLAKVNSHYQPDNTLRFIHRSGIEKSAKTFCLTGLFDEICSRRIQDLIGITGVNRYPPMVTVRLKDANFRRVQTVLVFLHVVPLKRFRCVRQAIEIGMYKGEMRCIDEVFE
jgi:hypothetical protein